MSLKRKIWTLVAVTIITAGICITNPFGINERITDLLNGNYDVVAATAYVDTTTTITLPESEFSISLSFDFGSEYPAGSNDPELWNELQRELQELFLSNGVFNQKKIVSQVPTINWLKQNAEVWSSGTRVHYVLDLPVDGILMAASTKQQYQSVTAYDDAPFAGEVNGYYFTYQIKDYTSQHVMGWYANDSVTADILHEKQLLFIYPDGHKIILTVPSEMLNEGVAEGDTFSLRMKKVE